MLNSWTSSHAERPFYPTSSHEANNPIDGPSTLFHHTVMSFIVEPTSSLGATHFELVPLKSLEGELAELPSGSLVSVTCSPRKGNDRTMEICERLQRQGFRATPHISARMVRDSDHLQDLAERSRTAGISEWFVVGGDADVVGRYSSGEALLIDLLGMDHGLNRIGVPAYPDGHPSIPDSTLASALLAKQQLLAAAGVASWASTQLCFSAKAITGWLDAQRDTGFTMPIRLGIAGPVERSKLITLGLKVGVGQSLRYLRKQGIGLLAGRYDPTSLVKDIAPHAAALGIDAIHLFTFNQLAASVAWRDRAAS